MMMSDDPPVNGPQPPAEEPRSRGSSCLHSCVTGVLLLTVVGLVALLWMSGWSVGEIRKNLTRQFSEQFWKVNLEENFRAETLKIASTNGNELTLARHERKEVFERDTVVVVPLLNRAVPFSDRKTKVAFPATYRYHILLNDPWAIETQEETVVVRAPEIRATLPVAFDSGKVKTDTEGWWVSGGRAGTDAEALKKRITEKLNEQAQTEEMIDAVRDECRDSLAKFVKNWLMKEDYWRAGRFTEIKVLFPDEGEAMLGEMEPVLEFGEEEEEGMQLEVGT